MYRDNPLNCFVVLIQPRRDFPTGIAEYGFADEWGLLSVLVVIKVRK